MCVGAMLQARVDRVVLGRRSPKAGALGGLFDLNAASPTTTGSAGALGRPGGRVRERD